MSTTQHCQLAANLAFSGNCFVAGQHLSFCEGPNRDATYAYTQRVCSMRSQPVVSAMPGPATQTADGTRAPAGPPADAGEAACQNAVKEALFGGCADALRSLDDCRGATQAEARSKVEHWCSRTPMPDPDVTDPFKNR